MASLAIPSFMKAIQYARAGHFELVTIPVPRPQEDEILVKVRSCGICGTDLHIHDGEFPSKMPVVTGHETSGEVVLLGSSVQGFNLGDKVTADSTVMCQHCHFCRAGKPLQCTNLNGHGTTMDGGFAEYCVFPASKLFHFTHMSWKEASLFEAAACAVHGMDRIRPAVGSKILQLGAGPTGLCLSQLLKLNGGSHVVMASRQGPKMDLARSLNVADEYLPIDRNCSDADWEELKTRHPLGFDIVVEATGDVAVLKRAFECCAKGGTVVLYGVYPPSAQAQISPSAIFLNEITILGSFSTVNCMARAVSYLESRKVDVRGIVTHTFRLEDFGEALRAVREKKCVKATVLMG